MLSLKKIKLNVLFIIGLSTILILLTVALASISINSVSFLGKYAIKMDKENTNYNAKVFFWEITRRTAGAYSIYFSGIESFVDIIGRACQQLLTRRSNNFEAAKNEIRFKKIGNTGLYVGNSEFNENIFYWGSAKNLLTAKNEVYKLSHLKTLISDINKQNIKYVKRFWIHTANDLEYEYPAETYFKGIKGAEILVDYYKNIFNRYSISRRNLNHNEIKAYWGKPYKDISGEILFTSYAPVYNDDGDLICITGTDIRFMKLIKTMEKNALLSESFAPLSEHNRSIYDAIDGFLFIVDKNGYVLLFPEKYSDLFSLPQNYSNLKDYSEKIQVNLMNSGNPKIKHLITKMCNHNIGEERIFLKGHKYIIAYCVIPSTGWRLGFVTKEKSLMKSADKTKSQMMTTEKSMSIRLVLTALIYLILSILAAIIFFKIFFFKPLKNIRNEIKKMGDGNFNISINEDGAAEISELSKAFNYLGHELRDYMKNLETEVAARKAVEAEIKLAGDMQQSILPRIKQLPKIDSFDITAKLQVAKDISGDFYDVFYITKNKIAVVIGDVSGKGLQAAFFMAMSKVLIKNFSLSIKNNPALVLEKTNELLCLDNNAKMFSTVFLAFYEIETGKVYYANAGHHASIVISNDNEYRKFGVFFDTALGFFDNSRYQQGVTELKENEMMVLFTDGLIDANCMNKDPFGEERLLKIIYKNKNLNLDQIAEKIIKNVLEHEADRQFDDITLMLLRKNGNKE